MAAGDAVPAVGEKHPGDWKSPSENLVYADVDGHIKVRVGNNGVCVSDELIGRIFDPYYTTKKGGTGLGLYIARKIITQHFNGSIGCSNVEDGVEFVVMLPV